MDKFVGKWKLVSLIPNSSNEVPQRNTTCTIVKLKNDEIMIQSEWESFDHKNHFTGYTIYPDGIPRKASGCNLRFVTQVRDDTMTTSRIEDSRIKKMEIREILSNGYLKVTTVDVMESGSYPKKVVYYRKMDFVG